MNKNKYLSKIIPVLKEGGLEMSMDAIAEAVGITKKTLYNQFSSKDELIKSCMDLLSEEFRQKVSPLLDLSIPVQDGFCKGIEGLRKFFKECSHSFMNDMTRVYPGMASDSHTLGTIYFEQSLKQNIERGISEGVYRSDMDSTLFSRYVAQSIFGFFIREVMRSSDFTADHYFKQVIEFNLNALIKK